MTSTDRAVPGRKNFRWTLKDQQFRVRLFLIANSVIPLLLALAGFVWTLNRQATELAAAQIEAVNRIVHQAREDEIQHFVQAGRRVLSHFCAKSSTDAHAMKEGKELLRRMDFGAKSDDNYFFIYTLTGTNVMHPRLPALEGKNLWDLKDEEGTFLIQQLIAKASAGGGFVKYLWPRPSTNQVERKLGYAEIVPECNWMVGTGLYLDHIRETEDIIRNKTRFQVESTAEKIMLIALAALLLVAAGGLAVNLNGQRTANGKLRAMAQKVVQSQELERNRVARELHDGVSQSLASVKYIFESADVRIERGKLESAAKLIKDGIAQLISAMVDVRRISHDLYPTILDDQGLGVALKQLAREFSSRTGTDVSVQVATLPEIQREAAKSLYRFAQQALGNIENHASARHVTLQVRFTKGIFLAIADDGVGFDVATVLQQPRNGLGITNMRERIEMLGGSFLITSKPGLTEVNAYLPAESLNAN